MPTYHRVNGKHRPRAVICRLPQDRWHEQIFIEAETGEEFVVVYSGMRMPSDCWPEGTSVKGERMPAHGHSHRPRQTT